MAHIDAIDKSHSYEEERNEGSHVVVHEEVEKKILHEDGKVVAHLEKKSGVHESHASRAFHEAQKAFDDSSHVDDDETQEMDHASTYMKNHQCQNLNDHYHHHPQIFFLEYVYDDLFPFSF